MSYQHEPVDPSIFYRCYSEESAGGLTCGLRRVGSRLSETDLSTHFERHRVQGNRNPTALVSVSDRPIEALHRAFVKHYNYGEDPSTISIVIISVPDTTAIEKPYHHAQKLADGAIEFKHEYIFEWQIPQQYVEHIVSVETILSRGIDLREYLDHGDNGSRLPNLSTFMARLSGGISRHDGYGFGRHVARIARCFGARAPVQEIALRILEDCPGYFNILTVEPDTRYFYWVDLGIEEEMFDSWLGNSTFLLRRRDFEERSKHMRDNVEWMWVDHNLDFYQDSELGISSHYADEARQRLEKYEENIEIEIEEEAVAIGL
ncbi:unnamed protein product [Penicillium olsonii]|uniref:DUF7587 domain-containing protein n=1 Tax=Penicillium olsonii TaxID=99116 RepID=A0A9W4HD67_PENOL|nr:unnamed protein product [Penicillium olsonii]